MFTNQLGAKTSPPPAAHATNGPTHMDPFAMIRFLDSAGAAVGQNNNWGHQRSRSRRLVAAVRTASTRPSATGARALHEARSMRRRSVGRARRRPSRHESQDHGLRATEELSSTSTMTINRRTRAPAFRWVPSFGGHDDHLRPSWCWWCRSCSRWRSSASLGSHRARRPLVPVLPFLRRNSPIMKRAYGFDRPPPVLRHLVWNAQRQSWDLDRD
jgi:hypothetical protein